LALVKANKKIVMIEKFEDPNKPNFISDKKLFTKIWTSPRDVFKFLNTYKYDKYVTLLLILGGITRTFDRASSKNMGDTLSIEVVILLCIVIGALFGWLSYYIFAALLNWTGKWLKAKGNIDSLLRVIAYALIPSIFSLLLLIPQIAIYGNELFKSDGDVSSAGLIPNIIVYSSIFIEFVLAIWSLVLIVIGISEVQKLSIGKSILNLFLPVIVVIVPIILIISLIYLFK